MVDKDKTKFLLEIVHNKEYTSFLRMNARTALNRMGYTNTDIDSLPGMKKFVDEQLKMGGSSMALKTRFKEEYEEPVKRKTFKPLTFIVAITVIMFITMGVIFAFFSMAVDINEKTKQVIEEIVEEGKEGRSI